MASQAEEQQGAKDQDHAGHKRGGFVELTLEVRVLHGCAADDGGVRELVAEPVDGLGERGVGPVEVRAAWTSTRPLSSADWLRRIRQQR